MTGTALGDAVDALLRADRSTLSSLELMDLVEAVEVQRRRLDAVDAVLVAELESRRVAGDYGRTSTRDLLVHRLRVAPREAKARVERAADLGPRTTLNGEPLPPVLPAASAALAAGEVSGAHVQVIVDAVAEVPPELGLEVPAIVEQTLVECARHEDPARLRRDAVVLLAGLDPDGLEPAEQAAQRRRGLTLSPCGDGTSRWSASVTAEATAVWQAVLDALAAPRPDADGAPDPRTPAQRRHDALLEAGLMVLRSGVLPDVAGAPVTVLVRVDADQLGPGGIAQTAHGGLLDLRVLERLGGDGVVQTVLLGHDEDSLRCGRTIRLANRAQRRALAARDGGCAFPGCDRPFAWCEIHHVVPWTAGGATDVDNLVPLCVHHHRRLDAGDWTLVMLDGRPHWLPPPWLDPDRRPVRNDVHHLPRVAFDLSSALPCPDTG